MYTNTRVCYLAVDVRGIEMHMFLRMYNNIVVLIGVSTGRARSTGRRNTASVGRCARRRVPYAR